MGELDRSKEVNSCFQRRGKSYKDGMLLLIDYLTEREWRLYSKDSSVLSDLIDAPKKQFRHQVEGFYQAYLRDLLDDNVTFQAKEKHLRALLQSYSYILSQQMALSDYFLFLSAAERCAVWQKGRQAFVSKFTLDTRENAQPLNIAQHEAPFTDDKLLLEEFSELPSRAWFKLLPSWQQVFIEKNKSSLAKQSIPSSLRCVPGLANLSAHRCEINGVERLAYFRHATQLPVDLLKKKGVEVKDEAFRLSCLNVASQIRLSLSQQLERTQPENWGEAVILTQSILSPGRAANIKSALFTDPSDNDTQIYELKEQAVELFQRAIANPNKAMTAKDVSQVKAFLTHDDVTKTLYYRDFLAKFDLKTQSNGLFEYKFKPKTLGNGDSPEASELIKITLLSTNHPFNILRHLGVYSPQTKRNALNTSRLLAAVARYLEPLRQQRYLLSSREISIDKSGRTPDVLKYMEESKRLEFFNSRLIKLIEALNGCEGASSISTYTKENLIEIIGELLSKKEERRALLDENTIRLLDALQALLSIPATPGILTRLLGAVRVLLSILGIRWGRHHQQLISSAEATILHCIGGTFWVACKSGKDRTGGASAAYDAAAAFYLQCGRHPRHDDSKADRALYLSLLSQCYESGHQQKFAAESAPGAQGLLGANLFLAGDLRVNNEKIKQETQLARLNKPKLELTKQAQNTFNKQLLENQNQQRLSDIFKQLLEEELNEITNKVVEVDLGASATLADWNRGDYYLNKESVREVRKDKQQFPDGIFPDEQSLLSIIDSKLFAKEQDEGLKKYYRALIGYAFHQGGFPYASPFLVVNQFGCILADGDKGKRPAAALGSPTKVKIYYTYAKNALQIETICAYETIKVDSSLKGDWDEIKAKKDTFFCETHTVISLALREDKSKDTAYQLETSIKYSDIKFTGQGRLLEPLFLQKSKQQKVLNAKQLPVLNQKWLDRLKAENGRQSRRQEKQVYKTKAASDKPMLLIGEVKNVTQVAAEVSTISNDEKTNLSNARQMPEESVRSAIEAEPRDATAAAMEQFHPKLNNSRVAGVTRIFSKSKEKTSVMVNESTCERPRPQCVS